MSESWKYKIGEEVLAYDGPLLYRGIIEHQKFFQPGDRFLSQADDPGAWYVVKFPGYGAKSLVYVAETQVLPMTDENKELKKKLEEEVRLANPANGKKRKKTPRPGNESDSESNKRKSSRTKDDTPDPSWRLKALELDMPHVLQEFLVQDMTNVRRGKVATLPQRTTVSAALKSFVSVQEKIAMTDAKNKGKQPRVMAQMELDNQERRQFVEALMLYFDNLVHDVLLYDIEKTGFRSVRLKKIRPCDAYGVEHLLRLCGTLLRDTEY